MGLSPESIEVGKCYVTEAGQERHVISAESGKVTYLAGRQLALWMLLRRRHVMRRTTFAAQAVQEVVCTHGVVRKPLGPP